MQYRPEIDGLRALAVLPVILFHAGFQVFAGGYIGVDVFFVISGYLITSILLADIEGGEFSLAKFYERRARRILPALIFVLLACIPFAWAWMLPGQLQDFSAALLAVSLFGSNIWFWQHSGYFDSAAEENPLLHTWSLAVEEQYYLLFPIFLLLAWRFGRGKLVWLMLALALLSLLLSEWGWRNAPSANFYLAPSRAWELLAGSITAYWVRNYGLRESNALSAVGLMGILIPIFFYDHTLPFPGLLALPPVIGTALICLSAGPTTITARVLSLRWLVAIGLISYSAYLWHQPLFAFARIKLVDPSMLVMSTLSIVALVMAYLSWRFVEQPFRANSGLVTRQSTVFLHERNGDSRDLNNWIRRPVKQRVSATRGERSLAC